MSQLVRLSCLALTATLLEAQVSTQSIFGTVTDSSGSAVPNVVVAAVNTETNFTRTAATDAAGQYSIRFLPTGTYRVELSLSHH